MNLVAIIQARVGSTRLPAKVLKDIAGKPMLARVVERVQRATLPQLVVVATSSLAGDDAVAELVHAHKIPVFRGNELDVLDRYYRAALEYEAEIVVRITADCPLIDPELIDRVIEAFLEARPDYAANSLVRTYPRGLDVEVASMESLETAWREARAPYERTHVMPYLYQHSDRFRCLNVPGNTDNSDHRWTVDIGADLEFVRAVYARLGPSRDFNWLDVLALLEREPELVSINRDVLQKTLEEC